MSKKDKLIKELKETFNCEITIEIKNDIEFFYVEFMGEDTPLNRVKYLDKISKINRNLPLTMHVTTRRK